MPNVKGGKNYKKSKNVTEDPTFIEAAEGQLYGRIVRNLGNSNMIVFCNDNKRRICHIRGGIRKKVWLNVGDIVLVSVREFEKVERGEFERGDILTKCDPATFGRLKKAAGFNLRLFMDLEKLSDNSEGWNSTHIDGSILEGMVRGSAADDDIFERGGASADADTEADEETAEEAAARKKAAAIAAVPQYNRKKVLDEDAFNIDDI
jgi:initiation factor 1A